MKCKLVKHSELSGDYATIYSIQLEGGKTTKLIEFIEDNYTKYKAEVSEIIKRLKVIGHNTGAHEDFFKHNEGKPGDGVCALYDKEKSNLRLYCIRNGKQIVIVGSGAHKPKTIRALQEDPKLRRENELLQKVSKKITEQINNTLFYSRSGLFYEGELEFYLDD